MESQGPILSVGEALEMPILAKARVIAGHSGLSNRIRWVHIVDIPDANFEWGRRGVLLLTAGFGLKDDPESQKTLIPRLVEQGFAGMILSVGQYFEDTPHVMRQAADKLGLPLIETPSDVLFVDVTEAIFERIISRQYALLQQSNRIHSKLTQLVLEGSNLNHLASTLASLLERPVTIEDSSFRVLAAAKHGSVDKARRRSVAHRRTTPELAQRLIDGGIYDQLLSRMEPVYVPPMPDLGMTMERIVAPIIVDREAHGYIWIIAGDHALNELDELAVGHGATVAALMLLKDHAVRKAEEALRGDFFNQLLRGAADSADLTEQARQLNYNMNEPHQVLLIDRTSKVGAVSRSFQDVVAAWLHDRGNQALAVWRDDRLVLVIGSQVAATGKQIAHSIVQDLNHPTSHLSIGVGSVFQPLVEEPAGLRDSYEQAREAARVGAAMNPGGSVTTFEELGLLHWLYHVPLEQQSGNIFLEHIRKLATYDADQDKELVKTLEIYLDHGGSLADASQALYIHRNTLLHRVDRIEALCHVDLRDPLQRLNLHAAVKYYRLHNL
jgi:purine catabolism regulator